MIRLMVTQWGGAVLFASLLNLANAATDLTVGVDSGQSGSQVTLPINLSSDQSIVGLQIDVNFDSNQLDSLGVTAGSILSSNHLVESSILGAGTRRVLVYSEQNLPISNGEVLQISFGIAQSAAPGTVAVGLSGVLIADPDAAAVTADSLDDGSVVVQDLVATIQGRYLFYGGSAFASTGNNDAIASDKQALLPGAAATFANYSSYVRGINGVMVDISDLANASGIGADDFSFNVGNSNDPSSWIAATAPSISVDEGGGVNGSDRVTLVWADNVIQKQWLEVSVLATSDTGLGSNDVFYFGNAVGDSGNSAVNAQVDVSDEIGARNNPRNFLNPATIDFAHDHNRDKKVDVSDEVAARNNSTNFLTALKLIDLTGISGSAVVTASVRAALRTVSLGEGRAGEGSSNDESTRTLGQAWGVLVIERSSVSGELLIRTREGDASNMVLQVSEDLEQPNWRPLSRVDAVFGKTGEHREVWRVSPHSGRQFFRALATEAGDSQQAVK